MRESLPTPDALRGFLEEQRTSDARPIVAAAAVVAGAVGASATGDGGSRDTRGERPLLILRGLAPAFVHVLLDSPLGIDAEFVAAHAARRRYHAPRPLGSQAVAAAQWNYPEFVGGLAQAMLTGQHGTLLPIGDVLGRVAVRAVSDCEDLAAAECRASVWVGEEVDVLFLDQPAWEEPGSRLRKGERKSAMAVGERWVDETKGTRRGASSTKKDYEKSEEIPSLEDALQERMSVSADATGSKLVDILEEAAYDKWLDFFEVLTPRQSPLIADGSSLEWRALQALEQNLDMAKRLAHTTQRHIGPTDSTPDWSTLLQRLRDRTALLATIPPTSALSPPAHKDKYSNFHTDNFTNLPVPRRRPRARSPLPVPAKGGGGGGDDNQRALDRLTYLGGILLPISIVSSVLSMNEDFEPGHSLFWVFWAAAVPLTLLTFAVIYADKLRSAEVWVEIGSLGAGPSSVDQVVETAITGTKKKNKGKKTKTHEDQGYPENEKWDKWEVDNRSRRDHHPPGIRPQAMAYAGDDIVIDLSDAVAQSQPITLEPRVSQRPGDDVVDDPHRPASSSPQSDLPQPSDDDDDDDMDPDPNMYVTRPTNGERPHAWRKKQLGWGGAAMCILTMQKPLRVEDGLPVAPEPKRDVERRLRQVRRKASAEG